MDALAVYGPPIVGAQSHLAVEKVLVDVVVLFALHFGGFRSLICNSDSSTLLVPVPRLLERAPRNSKWTKINIVALSVARYYSCVLVLLSFAAMVPNRKRSASLALFVTLQLGAV